MHRQCFALFTRCVRGNKIIPQACQFLQSKKMIHHRDWIWAGKDTTLNALFLSVCLVSHLIFYLFEAQNYFDEMWKEHGIMATPEHYACMVDVLGRAGLLEEAANFVRKMPIEPTSVVWMALLGACRIYGYKELASYAAAQILVTEPENSAAFLLVSSLDVSITEDDEAVEMG